MLVQVDTSRLVKEFKIPSEVNRKERACYSDELRNESWILIELHGVLSVLNSSSSNLSGMNLGKLEFSPGVTSIFI